MTQGNPFDLIEGDPKIERAAFQALRERFKQRAKELELEFGVDQPENMAKPQRTMSKYVRPLLIRTESSIVKPTVVANNFEIKPNIIQMVQQFVQFDRLHDKDSNSHIANFLKLYDTFKINEATNDEIRLRLFPFSLRNRAKQWLNSLPRGSITTWNQMTEKFI